jgi:Txe/YoeB family toxin of Txe-Axe toxin-antitoxin module
MLQTSKTLTNTIPSENEINTLKHSLRILNENEILEVIRGKVDVPSTVKKTQQLKDFIIYNFQIGVIPKEIYNQLRTKAFNPELDLTDGFYLSSDDDFHVVSEEELKKLISEWNNSDEIGYESEIKILNYTDEVITFLVTKKLEKFVYDQESMYSTRYTEDHQVVVEYYIKNKILFFQTTNTVKYASVKTVLQDFFRFAFNNEGLRLTVPRLNPKINFTLNSDGWSVTSFREINPTTLKLLDLFLELDKEENNFSHFECIDIKFDHEDTERKELSAKVNTQSYDGGDLLATEDVKKLIINKRTILFAEFKLTYIEELDEERVRYHTVLAGIQYDKNKHLRIYIKNNDLGLKSIIKKAYADLKRVFIDHYGDVNLKNEDKIDALLGQKDG